VQRTILDPRQRGRLEFNELSAVAIYPLNNTDVLVIGGGPAGSTAATLLVERGYQVVLLEKEHHPRFHIGESLLPANLPILARLGVADEVKAIGMQKWGAEFISPWDGKHQSFEFAEGWNKSLPFAYQVRRSQFDEILFRRAARAGAQAIEGCRVRDVEFLPDGSAVRVHAAMEDGRNESWQARFLVDASGRDTFLGNRLKAKRRNTRHSSAALYGHFRGAQRYTDKRAGDISIYWFDHGWFWFIPLADGTTSVGAVVWPYYTKTRSVPVRDFFLTTIDLCPPLAERLQGAELVADVTATGNFSYVCDRAYGANYLLLGDAYTFIDPMFSSGVMLAMNSAVAGADTIDRCLQDPAHASQALKSFERVMRRGPKAYSWFIYRVTNPTMREMFMGPRNLLRMKEALLSLLAGDIFGKTPIWASLHAFKITYYLISLKNFKRSLAAARRRISNIRPIEPERTTAN
jgi:flavin-dependent dehydrogenase